MRVPLRYRTRWGYTFCALIMGAVFSTLFFIGLSLIQTSNLHLESLPGFLLFSLGSAPAAYICWPRKTRRSAVRMALAGLFTVGLAFLLLGLALGSVAGVGEILEGRPADAPGMFFMIGKTNGEKARQSHPNCT
ncbi:MAG: hypothetical protein AAFP97_03350, partial [Pseudomonadota bacterium]